MLRLCRQVNYLGRNKLDCYAIIMYSLITESAMKKIDVNSAFVFTVDVKANRQQIKQAMKKLSGLEVAKINTLIRHERQKTYVQLVPDCDALDVANKLRF
ncbi:PREDICTED: 60S ribosomal protein L23a-like [Elephantulus edwardii]|uniref:60S ribosomal protein L23a-like n=1 Tax=Elephantulus edwardii TaxID=28737 RepID=UPI0003F06350|nr:PREDICTED: 60S ribosomal protein L23a-like [Elephantulus edwardii]